MSIPGSSGALFLATAAGAGGYQVERSLRFNSSDSAYLSRTPSSAGDRKKWTWAAWVKRSALSVDQSLFSAYTGSASDEAYTDFFFSSDNTLRLGGWFTTWRTTTQVFRDTSAWYHIVLAVDIANATANDRVKLYVNGAQVTTFSTTNNPATTSQFAVNSTSTHNIGANAYYTNTTNKFSGYIADCYFIDSQALDPTSFTEVSATTGQLIPKAYTGTFTGNSFWLKFADNSAATATTLGKDSSGLGNNWTPNNLSVTAGAGNDSLVDTPTSYGTDTGAGGEVRGNYCTLNPLKGGSPTNGNLEQQNSSPINFGTIGVSSGKWYFETVITTQTSGGIKIGVAQQSATGELGDTATAWAILGQSNVNNGQAINNGSLTSSYTTFAQGDVVNCAFDLDSGKIWWGKNGTWLNSGNPAAGTNAIYSNLSGTIHPAATANQGGYLTWNFGQRPFAYTAPSGFKALCDTNLPTPVVAKPNTVMDVITYTGTGSSLALPNGSSTPTSISFTPDFAWIKGRSGATDHALYDAVRGVQKDLVSNSTSAETTETTGLTAFGTNTFTVGSLAKLNTSSSTYVAWAWNAGGSTVTNTQGSITSSVRANPSAGFSIVKFNTGSSTPFTVGHGLGVKPALIIDKATGATGNWSVYHSALGATKFLRLNLTNAADTQAYPWNNTEPTSTVFTGGDLAYWGTNFDHICYCFAPVVGYSSFGSYTGNGSSDGPFVYTGFRPKFIMRKRSDSTGDWIIMDTSRDSFNQVDKRLNPNLSNAEASGGNIVDILSNGWKERNLDGYSNASGGTYVWAAFAESPFQFSRAR